MLYFLIWKALKSYRYLYISYFSSSGVILGEPGGQGRCSAWGRLPVAEARTAAAGCLPLSGFSLLRGSVCSRSRVSLVLFK